MKRLWHSIRTPAFVVAVLALAAALFGTAIAASPQASQSSVKKIAQTALKKANQALSIASTTSKEKGPKGDPGAQGNPGAAGSPGVSGYEIVRDETPSNSDDHKEISPECPAGKKVIGGGALTTGPAFEDTAIDASVMEEEAGWFASAHEHAATGEVWSLIVEMVCAKVN